MAKKPVGNKEVDLDDFDFDDFDFEIPDFEDPDPANDDRKPVEKLSSGFKKGFKERALSTDLIKRSVGTSFPRGYAQAINVFDTTSETAKELYNSVAQDLRPVTDGMRSAASKISPKIKSKLPKSLADRLQSFSEGGSSGSSYSASRMKREAEESEISSVIAQLFNAQSARDTEALAEEKAETVVRDIVDNKRHKESMSQMTVVAQGISRLVGYQDSVLTKYQQKSLELQYRHYFVARDLLEITGDHQGKMIAAIDKVVKNTALPEAVKIRQSELASQMLKERMIGSTFGNINNWTRNYRENLVKNVGDAVKGFTSNLTMGQGAVSGITDNMGGMQGSGYLAGQAIAEALHDSLATRAAPYMEKVPGLRKFGAKMGNMLTNAPKKLSKWAKSETEGDGMKAGITQFIKDLLPKYYLNDKISSAGALDSDQPALFDNLTRRSIVEIIPGYLAQINRWTKAMATGQLDDDDKMDVFNLERGSFTSKKTYLKDMKRRLMPNQEISGIRGQLDDFVNELDDQGVLNPEIRRSLKRQMLAATAKGDAFDPKDLLKREFYKDVPEEHIDDLRYFFRNKFNIDIDGKMEDTVESHDEFSKYQQKFESFTQSMPNTSDYVRTLYGVYGRDNLRKLGLISRVGGQDTINQNHIYDSILDAQGLDPTQGGDDEEVRQYQLNRAFGGRPLPSQRPSSLPLPQQATVNRSSAISDAGLEKYLGQESILIQQMLGLRADVKGNNISELVAMQAEMLSEINGKIGYIGGGGEGGAGAPNAPRGGRFGRWLKGGLGGAATGAKAYSKAVWGFYKGLGTAGMWSGSKVLGGLKTAGNKLLERGKEIDIYVKGQTIPALRNSLIQAGEYIDVNTQKVIRSAKDITGEVRDKHGNIVLSNKEYLEGLVSQAGKSIAGKAASAGAAIGNGLLNVYTYPYKLMWRTAKAAFSKFAREKKEQLDLYIKGESSPRLLKRVMEENGYFDKTTRKVIRSFDDIKGDVVDKYGNVVVTLEEIQNNGGFVDAAGRAIKSGISSLGGLIGEGAKLYGKAVLGLYKGIGKGARWVGRKIGGLFGKRRGAGMGTEDADDLVNLNYHQLTVQERILSVLEDHFKPKSRHDANGDGMRDGSYRDLMEKRKARLAAQNADKEGTGSKGDKVGTGLFSKLAGLFGNKKDAEEEDDSSLLSDAADVADIADAVDRDGRPRRRGKVGRMGRAWDKVKKGGKWALGGAWTASKFIGKQVLWRGATMAASAIASVVSAPVALGAAAAVGIGYGSYKAYRFFADKPTALRGMRYAQYGINPRDADQIAVIGFLEDALIKSASYDADGQVKMGQTAVDTSQLLKLVKITEGESDESNRRTGQLVSWLQQRFLPVLKAHLTALNRLSPNLKLNDVDNKLPAQQGLDYIKATRLDELASVYDNTEMSPFEDELDCDADDVKSWTEDAVAFYEKKVKSLPPEQQVAGAGVTAAAAAKAASASGTVEAAKKTAITGSEKSSSWWSTAGKIGLMGLASPVLAGAALFGGQSVFNKITGILLPTKKTPKLSLDALTAGRYRVYGLYSMDTDKVTGLYNLEEAMWNDVAYNNENAAYYGGTSEALYPLVKNYFEIKDDDQTHRQLWFSWFQNRYLPAFLQFCTAVRSLQSIDARNASDKLTLDEQYEVLKQTSGAMTTGKHQMSVWKATNSPWKGYQLNTDESLLDPLLETLKSAATRAGFKEPGQKTSDVKAQLEMAKRQESMSKDGGFKADPSEPERKRGFFSRTMDKVFGGKDATGTRTGGWFGPSIDPNKDLTDGKAGPLKGGMVIQNHPGGGTGGDVNAIPVPTGAGWAASKATILAAAKMTGFDPAIAATIAGLESNFDPAARPWADKGKTRLLSSAGGYYQFIDSTWNSMLKKYGAKYGLAPDASKFDGRANALMGMEFLKENMEYLQKRLGRPITDTDLYAAHFLGPNGAARFLGANPGSDARGSVGDSVPSSNPSVFFERNGNARTVSGVYAELDKRMEISRKKHDIEPGFKFDSQAVDEQGNPLDTASQEGTGVADAHVASDASSQAAAAQATGDPVGDPKAATTRGGQAIAQGKAAATAAGIQPTSVAAPVATGAGDPVGDPAMAASVKAAIAQKQASAESGALNESMNSVTSLMNQQLAVQTSMNAHLGTIVEMIKAGALVPATSQSQTASAASQPSRSGTPKSANGLSNVPVDVNRQRAT